MLVHNIVKKDVHMRKKENNIQKVMKGWMKKKNTTCAWWLRLNQNKGWVMNYIEHEWNFIIMMYVWMLNHIHGDGWYYW